MKSCPFKLVVAPGLDRRAMDIRSFPSSPDMFIAIYRYSNHTVHTSSILQTPPPSTPSLQLCLNRKRGGSRPGHKCGQAAGSASSVLSRAMTCCLSWVGLLLIMVLRRKIKCHSTSGWCKPELWAVLINLWEVDFGLGKLNFQ